MKQYLTWPSFVKLVCGIVAISLIGCIIAKLINPDVLKDYKFEYLLLALAVALLLPYINELEAFGVKLSVQEKVDDLSDWVKGSPYYTLGSECEEIEGDNLLAEQYYRRSLEECPIYWPSILGLASIYHDEERYDRAIVYYQKVLELEHDNVYTYNNLAEIYLNAPPPIYDPQKALEFAEDAIKLIPSLGSAYYYKGEALNYLKEYQAAYDVLKGTLDAKYALKDDKYWVEYEMAISRSHLDKQVTMEDFEEMYRLAKADDAAGELVEALSSVDEQKRFKGEVQKTIQLFVKKHKGDLESEEERNARIKDK